jgi:hypothetical protein
MPTQSKQPPNRAVVFLQNSVLQRRGDNLSPANLTQYLFENVGHGFFRAVRHTRHG